MTFGLLHFTARVQAVDQTIFIPFEKRPILLREIIARIHVNRIAGRHRDHRYSGHPAFTCSQQGEGEGIHDCLPEQSSAMGLKHPPVCR